VKTGNKLSENFPETVITESFWSNEQLYLVYGNRFA
jgi:hypothetical protein